MAEAARARRETWTVRRAGHDVTDEANVYANPNGERQYRVCLRERRAERTVRERIGTMSPIAANRAAGLGNSGRHVIAEVGRDTRGTCAECARASYRRHDSRRRFLARIAKEVDAAAARLVPSDIAQLMVEEEYGTAVPSLLDL